MLVLGIIFCFFGLKYHLYLQYALTFIAGAFFGVRLLGMASDLLPGDLINADNEQYIGGAIGILLCLGIFFYNFWFYRILSACAGFGIAGGLTIVVGLFVPIVVDYVLYVAAVGAVAGIFFMSSYIQTFVGMIYLIFGAVLVASSCSFFMEELELAKTSPLWIANLIDSKGNSVDLRDAATLAAMAVGIVTALIGLYFSTRKKKETDEDEENAPLLKKKGSDKK